MTVFNLPDNEMETQMQKRIAELEKANQDLRAENISLKQDITTCKKSEETLRKGEQRVRLKLENGLLSSQKIDSLELSEIIDTQSIQYLLEDFYKLSHIPIGLNDLKGNVLVGVGWQDICTKFHRVHPEACKHCVESDINLSTGVAPGEYKLYKCKNNMWDVVTPIMVGDKHIGYIFAGQFFFEDESLDYELFRTQARQYGFNEEEYIEALEKVPRLSREAVNTGMSFLMTFANMLSQLSYSNIKLARSLEERDILVDTLWKRSAELEAVLDAVPASVYIAHDPQALHITGNRLSYEWLGVPVGTNFSKSAPEGEKPEFFKLFKNGKEIPPEKMPSQIAVTGREVNNCELDIVSIDGEIRHVLGNARPLRDEQGNLQGSVSAFIDITERNRAEEALKKEHENLEKIVGERTSELQTAYDSLKKSERSLAEAQEIAHIGNWERDFASNEFYWSDEMYRIFGLKPQELKVYYDTFLNYVHPDDRDYIKNTAKDALKGKPLDIDFRIIRANGEERIVHAKVEAVFDEKNNPVRIRGTTQDITEQKKAEEKIQILANAVESSTDAIITKSLDGVITSWNRGAEQVYGYSAKEVLGKQISILEPSSLKGETEKLAELIKQGEEIYNYVTSRLRKDGTIIDVSITLSPIFDSSGKITAISSIARDITESKIAEEKLRENEEKYRNIVETSNEGIYLVDDKARITYANKIMETSGYTLGELIGRPIWDFISEESIPVAKRSFEKRRQGIDDSYELKLMRKDGSFIWGLISAKSLFNKEGKFIGYLGMLTDITKRKEAEETLANIETARKKEIHHRIKNNLQVISSLLDLQAEHFRNRKDIKDSEVLEAFRESQDRVISMALIHEELYRGSGFETLNFSPYIQELAENLLLTYRLGTDVSLKMDLEENLLFDMDNAVPLGMIINELVSNSLKHAFPNRDKGEIRIELHREKNEECITENCKGTNFTLKVSDDGVGIPENLDIENLDSLGFQLVTSLVDQLDGEFELKRNKGAEFIMRFKVTGKSNQESVLQ